ncbi:MAG: flagellar biosynthesis protein FlgA [Thiotrichaceae bacterium]|nr:MAG: flagellar biosynthesis protein FlgA [Thiotrichaceae bacterium]
MFSLYINHLNKYLLFYGVSLILFSSVSHAAAYQSHTSIYKAAETFLSAHVLSKHNNQATVTVGKLDSRLKLKKCNKRLQAFLRKGSRRIGKATVGIKCTGTKPWSLHLPVTISVFGDVLVAKTQLHKGDILSASDLKIEKHDLANLPYGYIEEIASSAGMKIKKRIDAGTVLTPSMLKKPRIISRGQKVTILARLGRMQVRMEGKALAHGAAGERIQVMNLKSRKKLEGVITVNGEVKVDI